MAVYTETAGLVPTEAYHSRATHRLPSFYGSSSAARRQTGPAQPSLQQKLNILSSLSIHEPYLRKKKKGCGGGWFGVFRAHYSLYYSDVSKIQNGIWIFVFASRELLWWYFSFTVNQYSTAESGETDVLMSLTGFLDKGMFNLN